MANLKEDRGMARLLQWFDGWEKFGNEPVGLTTTMKDVMEVHEAWQRLKSFGPHVERCFEAWFNMMSRSPNLGD